MRANNEGTIYQRKDGRWVACVTQFRDGKTKRVSYYAASEEEARKRLTNLKHRQDEHQPIQFDSKSIGGWLETWLETFIRPRRKERTWAGYHEAIRNHVLPAIGKQPLADPPPELIQAMLNYHVERGCERTAQLVRAILHAAFKRAVKLHRMPWNPIDALDPITVTPKETAVFTAEEADAFLKAASGHRLEALFWLALGLGLRKGELCGLTLDDIDFQGEKVHVRQTIQRVKLPGEKTSRILEGTPKSRASYRELPLLEFLLEPLRRHITRRAEGECLAAPAWKESGRLFTSSIGTPLDPRKLNKTFHDLCVSAEVPKIRFHDLRHTCGTFLHLKGVSPFTIQEILGHAQISTTRRYTHADKTLQKAAIGKLGELLVKPFDSKFEDGSAVKAAVKPRLVRVK
jgi:integrase